ncbi:hypothetical protein PF010_g6864 [Phytophthora fragariae]|uniref:Uncharacterized protein n=1 Tax=Phytophthora fragariae TaxID=53985 RepID=A0A6G0LJ24_9STRA|nr:hypothetical protein PF010_g6864 [Phytophthora fragariae]
MDMLMSWLGENYTGYAEAKLARAKDAMLDPLVAQIRAVGFTNCKPRDLRLWITRLEKDAIAPPAQSKRRRLSTTARRRPETRESRGEDTTQVLQAASDSDHGSADIKTETGFQDGSVHAPLAVYDEALFDARLKFGRKKTLSQVEIDLYFPKPET